MLVAFGCSGGFRFVLQDDGGIKKSQPCWWLPPFPGIAKRLQPFQPPGQPQWSGVLQLHQLRLCCALVKLWVVLARQWLECSCRVRRDQRATLFRSGFPRARSTDRTDFTVLPCLPFGNDCYETSFRASCCKKGLVVGTPPSLRRNFGLSQ